MERGLREINGHNQMEVWSERVSACRTSGLSVAQWCNEAGVNPSSYYRWQRKLFQKLQETNEICFAEIPTKHLPSNNTVATLHIGDTCVELRNDASSELIHSLVEALKSC